MEKQFFTSVDVSMIGYGCDVSQYPQYYDQDLDKYQVLPCLYFGSFVSYPGEIFIKEKWVLDLAGQSETFLW